MFSHRVFNFKLDFLKLFLRISVIIIELRISSEMNSPQATIQTFGYIHKNHQLSKCINFVKQNLKLNYRYFMIFASDLDNSGILIKNVVYTTLEKSITS